MRARLLAGIAAGTLALVTLAAAPATAADPAKLSVLHGVPGLTVDVWVNGERTLDDFTPGSIAGPLDLPAGTYTVAITAADAADASSPRPSARSTSPWRPGRTTRPSPTSTPPAPRPRLCSPTTSPRRPPARAGSRSGTSPPHPRSTCSPAAPR